MSDRKIKLTSSEGTEFNVDRDVADKSIIVRNMLEDCAEDGMGKHLGWETWTILHGHVGNVCDTSRGAYLFWVSQYFALLATSVFHTNFIYSH